MQIVILEDNLERRAAMQELLADRLRQCPALFFATSAETIWYLQSYWEDVIAISLDHDLEMIDLGNRTLIDAGTGRDVADFLATRKPRCPVIIHSTNAHAVAGMQAELEQASWQVECVSPYGDLEWVGEWWFPTIQNSIPDHCGLDRNQHKFED